MLRQVTSKFTIIHTYTSCMCVTCTYMKLHIHTCMSHVCVTTSCNTCMYSTITYVYMTCMHTTCTTCTHYIIYTTYMDTYKYHKCVHFVFLFFSTVLVLVYSTMLNQQPPDGVYSLLDCFARLGAAF